MKKVSVVILNWNGAELLRRYLPSVCMHTPSDLAEIVVADNGSDDNSLEVLRDEFPQVAVIAMKANSGFAGGYNIALEQIDSEYVVLLNSDVEVTPRWLEPLVEYADSHPEVAAIQPKILSCRNRGFFEHAGAAGGYIDRFGFPFCRGRLFETVERDEGQYDSVTDVFWATGACMFVRTRDYKDAGGLDREFFAHMEEIDLCWRFHLMGKRVVCVPQSKVFHLGGATLDMDNPRKTYLNFRNNILMLYKNLPAQERDWLIFRRKLIDSLAALGFLAKGKPDNVKAILNAHRDASSMIRSMYVHSHKEGGGHQILGIFPYSGRSVVTDYYMHGKKRFSDLRSV